MNPTQSLKNLTAQQHNSYKFHLYTHQLKILFNELKDQNISFIILKGWSFLPDLYPDPSERPFGDVDILIHPEDYQIVTSILTDHNYTTKSSVRAGSPPLVRAGSPPLVRVGSEPAPAGSQPAPTITSSHIPLEITWVHPSSVHIDLHTHLLTLAWWQPAFPIDLDHVWHTAQPYPDSTSLQLLRLSPEVTFLHLCLHLWSHGIFNPQFHSYVDLVLLLRKYSHSMHWDHILHLANAWGLSNILYWVAQILHRDYKTNLPIQLTPKSSPTAFPHQYIHSMFTKSLQPESFQRTLKYNEELILNPHPWLPSFLLRLALIDRPSILPKLLLKSIFPDATLRTSIHNRPCSLLQHWHTYTRRLINF